MACCTEVVEWGRWNGVLAVCSPGGCRCGKAGRSRDRRDCGSRRTGCALWSVGEREPGDNQLPAARCMAGWQLNKCNDNVYETRCHSWNTGACESETCFVSCPPCRRTLLAAQSDADGWAPSRQATRSASAPAACKCAPYGLAFGSRDGGTTVFDSFSSAFVPSWLPPSSPGSGPQQPANTSSVSPLAPSWLQLSNPPHQALISGDRSVPPCPSTDRAYPFSRLPTSASPWLLFLI